jgi:hypothetical protein
MGGEEVISEIKREVLGGGAGRRNPDLHWDPRTGEIYFPIPGGGFQHTDYNVWDYIL